MIIHKDLKDDIAQWYLRNAPSAVLAELREAREYAERAGVSKVQAVARLVDAEHQIQRLLSPFPEQPELAARIAELEARLLRLEECAKTARKNTEEGEQAP